MRRPSGQIDLRKAEYVSREAEPKRSGHLAVVRERRVLSHRAGMVSLATSRKAERRNRVPLGRARISESRARMSESRARMSESRARMSESRARMSESRAQISESRSRTSEGRARISESRARRKP